MIRVENVSFTYHPGSGDEVNALVDVSFSVDRGEFVAVVGANGSGKSTLAKLLNALLLPTTGTVSVAGMATTAGDNIWEIRRRVGMVFQNPDNQLVATTVEEDVAFGPENLGLAPAEIVRRIEGALSSVGMEQFRHRSPHHLSGGQKQRIAIAGILAMQPDVIVLDEPTAMLDPRGRADVIRTARHLNRHLGMTVVHITHFMDEVAEVADRVIVLDAGRLVYDGDPPTVFAQAELLARAGLELPATAQIVRGLREHGIELPADAQLVGLDGLVETLCQLRSSA